MESCASPSVTVKKRTLILLMVVDMHRKVRIFTRDYFDGPLLYVVFLSYWIDRLTIVKNSVSRIPYQLVFFLNYTIQIKKRITYFWPIIRQTLIKENKVNHINKVITCDSKVQMSIFIYSSRNIWKFKVTSTQYRVCLTIESITAWQLLPIDDVRFWKNCCVI